MLYRIHAVCALNRMGKHIQICTSQLPKTKRTSKSLTNSLQNTAKCTAEWMEAPLVARGGVCHLLPKRLAAASTSHPRPSSPTAAIHWVFCEPAGATCTQPTHVTYLISVSYPPSLQLYLSWVPLAYTRGTQVEYM
eukprot:COSAG05_NODE_1198_length_5555_cov_3.672287_6_plen_136_part_00